MCACVCVHVCVLLVHAVSMASPEHIVCVLVCVRVCVRVHVCVLLVHAVSMASPEHT